MDCSEIGDIVPLNVAVTTEDAGDISGLIWLLQPSFFYFFELNLLLANNPFFSSMGAATGLSIKSSFSKSNWKKYNTFF